MSFAPILVLALAIGPAPVKTETPAVNPDIRVADLKAHVYRLASPEFLGRRGAGAARAARYILDAFERLHLRPAFGDSFEQPIPWLLAKDPETSFVGRNLGAMIPGSDPVLKDQFILLCAHYDHLGQRGDKIFPGADDNASGVAVLLELAGRFARRQEKPKRSILFIAFDQEESGLLGSTHFATHPPISFKKLKACVVTDMLGRSMANVMDEYVFALGSETASYLRNLVESVVPPKGLTVGRIGADLIGTRSDYGPFRDRRVPFLFLSTGQHPDYHRTTDLPDRIDYAKLRLIALWIEDLLWKLANDQETPVWNANGMPPDIDEARTILTLIKRVLKHPEIYPLTAKQHETVTEVEEKLLAIDQRGKITEAERAWLVWTARILMTTIF